MSSRDQSPSASGASLGSDRPAREPCDRAQILIERMQKGLGWHIGRQITEEMWADVKPHFRIALDTEVEAGGPYLNNGWNTQAGTTEQSALPRDEIQDTRSPL